jgi:hypothetical protein
LVPAVHAILDGLGRSGTLHREADGEKVKIV